MAAAALLRTPGSPTCTVTATYNAEDALAQWYIDVCAGYGIDHTGVPWRDGLLLCLVVGPGANLEVIAGAELEDAASVGEIDATTYILT